MVPQLIRNLRPFWVAAALLLLVAPALAGSGNVGFYASKDNSIYQEDGLSNGAGEHLFSGNTAFEAARRALLFFDVAPSDDLPADATILAVGIQMWCTKHPAANDAPREFSLHRLTEDWGEAGSNAGNPGGFGAPAEAGDATWSERFFGQGMLWTAPGGDFVPTPSATVTVGLCSETTPASVVFSSTPELVADVQSWLDDPDSNFGWILIGDEADPTTARRFSSRDHSNPPQAPLLDLYFEFGEEEVPATSLPGMTLLVLLVTTASVFALRRNG